LVDVPRFYFHLIDDFDAPDEEGVELPDLEAAREHAKGSPQPDVPTRSAGHIEALACGPSLISNVFWIWANACE